MGERSLVFGFSLYPNTNPILDPYKKLIFQIYFNTADNKLIA